MLQPTMNTLLGDDLGACRTLKEPQHIGAFARRAPARGAGLAAPTACAATLPASAVAARADRCLWVVLSRVLTGWRATLVIVKPETVIAWHRRGFRLWWAWRSRRRMGRPTTPLTSAHSFATWRTQTPAGVRRGFMANC